MKRIIDIPEEEIKRICENGVVEHIYLVADAIKDSIPLSERRAEDCISREDTYNTMRLMMDNATIGDSDDGGVYESLEAIKEQYFEIVKGMASVYPEPEIIDWNNCHTPKQLDSIATTKNNLGVENDLVSSIVEKISEKVTETREEFIFETIRPYCENVVQMKISKRDLEQALLKYYGKNNLGIDCISRQDVERYIEGFINEYTPKEELEFINLELDGLKHIPSATPQNQVYTLCEDCRTKMDEVRRAYDNAMKQEPILDKIRAEMLEEMLSHSGTGEEVIQAYADGLKKGLEITDKYKTESEK